MGLMSYLKAAFLNRWNLLAFLGGLGFAALSGQPDVVGALVLAGEFTYLGFLGTHPKFQKSVDAQLARGKRQDSSAQAEETVRRILAELPKPTVRQFEDLRTRCAELRQISARMREPVAPDSAPPLDDLQLASLDRLLWMYLRLLYTQHALSQFLQKTSERDLTSNIQLLEERLKTLPQGEEHPSRIRKVVEENLEMSRARLTNYRKAQENFEVMSLEVERLENTIHSLSELAVNRQEPNFITGQIDQVAASMVQTEKAMGELQFVTGFNPDDEQVPTLLRGVPVRH